MARRIRSIELSDVSVSEVNKILPNDISRTFISDCGIGIQPQKTYLLTSLYKVYDNLKRKQVTCKKLTVKEVQQDGSEGPLFVDLAIYGEHAEELDNLLKELGSRQQKVWLILQNVKISDYHGCFRDTWAKISLGVGVGGAASSVNTPDAEVWVVSKVKQPQRRQQHRQANLKTLEDCNEDKMKVTICVVIKKVLKENCLTKSGNYYSMYAVVDATCDSQMSLEGELFNDFLILVFNNSKSVELQTVEASDIIIFLDMQVAWYNDKFNGKIYSPKQVVKFSSRLSDAVNPVTASTSFRLDDEYKKAVIDLRKWWAEQGHRRQREKDNVGNSEEQEEEEMEVEESGLAQGENNIHRPQIPHYNTIENIVDVDECIVSILCQVVNVGTICLSGMKLTVLRVWDGTRTRATFIQYDLEKEEDEEQNTDSSGVRKIGSGSRTVDILCPLLPEQTRKRIKVNSFVCLTKILCRRVQQGRTEELEYELSYSSGKSTIKLLAPDDPQLQHLVIKLSSLSEDNASHTRTPASLPVETNSHPASQLPINDSMDVLMGNLPTDSQFLVDDPRNREQSGTRLPESDRTSNISESDTDNSERRPVNGNERLNTSLPRLHFPLFTTAISGEFKKSTLADVVKQGITEKLYAVEVQLYDMKQAAWNVCHVTHHRKLCLHLFVWGACEKCGFCLNSKEIMQQYPAHYFTQSTLPCKKCHPELPSSNASTAKECTNREEQPQPDDHRIPRSQRRLKKRELAKNTPPQTRNMKRRRLQIPQPESDEREKETTTLTSIAESGEGGIETKTAAEGEETPTAAASNTVHPFIYLELELFDPATSFKLSCDLVGDDFKDFFGVSCAFSWLLEESDGDKEREQASKLADALLRDCRPHEFGIKKVKSERGDLQFRICHTKLSLL